MLSGEAFEQALAVVFWQHGYTVERTPRTGDRGIDLIVCGRDGRRIGVQAKGYPSGASVGFRGIQEVYTGASLLNCHYGALITNSRFSRQAIETAQQFCERRQYIVLVHGRQLPSLAAGDLRI
jgi:HJR/Mrr/RecB family endonuclease